MNEEEILTEEELVEVDIDAKDMRFDDEVFLQTEDEDEEIEEDSEEIPEEFITIKTHNVEEAIPGMEEGK